MTTAREIIALAFSQAHQGTCYPEASLDECNIAASLILTRLTAAGFRVLAPEEIDPVTVEKCAEVAEQQVEMDNPAEYNQGLFDAAAAIRALAKEK